jgi:hypothetical protein
MALTLSKVMARAWRELGFSIDILATGGTTTTIIDTNSQYSADDALIGGTAIVVRDGGGSGAAPEGEMQRISDYVALTTTFTVGSAFSQAVASGDAVLLATPRIKLPQMRQAVNDGLADLGTVSLVDTSLSSAAAQTEYALPVGLKIKRLIDVQVQGITTDSNDNRYYSIIGQSRYVPAAPGSTGLLILPQLPSGRTIKIIYEGVHPTLFAYSDVISETIQEELAVAAAINKALTWYVSKRGDSALDTFVIQRWNDAKNMLQQQKSEKPIYRVKPKPKWFVAGRGPDTDEAAPIPYPP